MHSYCIESKRNFILTECVSFSSYKILFNYTGFDAHEEIKRIHDFASKDCVEERKSLEFGMFLFLFLFPFFFAATIVCESNVTVMIKTV